jgi:hypothetical protein
MKLVFFQFPREVRDKLNTDLDESDRCSILKDMPAGVPLIIPQISSQSMVPPGRTLVLITELVAEGLVKKVGDRYIEELLVS